MPSDPRRPPRGRHGGRTFRDLLERIAERPAPQGGDRDMRLLACFLERGVRGALEEDAASGTALRAPDAPPRLTKHSG